MYQIFGNEIYGSNEIIKDLFEKYDIQTMTDLSKSTDREDTIALKCSVSLDKISTEKIDMSNVDEFENIMSKTETYLDEIITSLGIKYSIHKIRAYRYDEVNNKIISIICIMYIESARKKINDVFKRLLKNNY